MKRRNLLVAAFFFTSFAARSQAPGPNEAFLFTYSAVGSGKAQDIKLVDLHSGAVIKSFFEDRKSFRILSAVSGKELKRGDQLLASDSLLQPMATTVAATAFDPRSNRLYYTMLGINQLRYIDLSPGVSTTFGYFDGVPFGATRGITDVPNQVTRMVIDANGTGYALSNDANHLLRFTTGSRMTVTDLGPVSDNASNTAVSIHTGCTSAGGDIVADTKGNLVLITSNNHVFTIDVNSKMATYDGNISGLPTGFTTNGAAVDKDGQLIVSCALDVPGNGFFRVDMNGLGATRTFLKGMIHQSSDLANSNILGQVATKQEIIQAAAAGSAKPRTFTLYPNPVRTGIVKMNFTNFAKGNYEVQIQDMLGTVVNKWSITIYSKEQVEEFNVKLFQATAQGVYVVRIMDKTKQTVLSHKIVVMK